MKEDSRPNCLLKPSLTKVSIQDFHIILGEKMTEEKLVRKILRSIPKRFDMKVTAIEGAQDIKKMKVEELIESL